MTVAGVIGPCSVCQCTAKLEKHGCSECVANFGARFTELAARVRKNPRFAAAVLEAIQEPSHRRIFIEYFGASGDRAPPLPRHPVED